MIRGLYISASGMKIQELEQNRVSNNLANASTVGFKKDTHVFRSFNEVLLQKMDRTLGGNYGRQAIGVINQGAAIDETRTDYGDGILQETGKPLDTALVGRGMFTIDTPEGLRFTRNGSFQLDNEGFLVSDHGGYVLGYNGLINLADENFSFSPEGDIFTADGWLIDSFLLADFEDWERLTKAGDNYFAIPDEVAVVPAEDILLRTGFVEKPNINLVQEIVDMITLNRIYEANQKAIQAQDEMLGKSVNEVGTVR